MKAKPPSQVICAISLAQLGKRVLLIDGDMRRPCVHKLFDIEDHSGGLVTYLTGEEEWHQLVRPTGMANLDCLVCGPVPPNPSELLSSDRMQTLIREAMTEYQFVLVDAPPLLNVADGRILATMVEGAILVVKGGFTPRELAQQAQLHVRDVGAHLIGVVSERCRRSSQRLLQGLLQVRRVRREQRTGREELSGASPAG